MLALLPSPDDGLCSEVLHGIVTLTRRLESAGRAFHSIYEPTPAATTAPRAAPESSTPSDVSGNEDEEEDRRWSEKHKKQKQTSGAPSRLKRLLDGPNLYEVLGLNEACSADAIRKAYRRFALQYHPDKQKSRQSPTASSSDGVGTHPGKRVPKVLEGMPEEQAFLLIQDAYETLSDSTFRRQYDSALPFDESIPTASDVDDTDPTSFFDVFAPVFGRNARWSAKKPVPTFGTGATPYRDVMRFYTFWWAFDSTRDFSVHDEYDVADAECREERRWMERQNQKIRRKHLQEEKSRITKLTDLAFSLDPRVKAKKEEERQRREDQKEAKRREAEALEAQRRDEEIRKRSEQEAQQRAAEEARRQEAEEKRRLKAAVRKGRQRFREICKDAESAGLLRTDEISLVATTLSLEALEAQVALQEGLSCARIAENVRREAVLIGEQQQGRPAAAQPKAAPAPLPAKKPVGFDDWSPEELSLLAKGVQKYPGGTARRWQLIATLIGSKSVEAVIEKTKQLADGTSLKSMGSSLNRTLLDQFIKDNAGALKPVTVPPDTREVADAPPAAAAASEDWPSEQQKCLEVALRTHPATLPAKERWAKIAADVPGRSPKECLARFKEIRNAILSSCRAPAPS